MIHVITLCSDQSCLLCRLVSFLFCLRRGVLCLFIVASTFLLSIEFNSDSFGIRTMIIKENYNVPTLVGEIQKIHRQEAVLRPDDFIYIYDMRPAVIMSQFPPPPAPRRLTRPARAIGHLHLIRLAAVSTKMGRNTPLLCVIVTVNTTLSGRGPATPSAQVYKACWDYVACDRFLPAWPITRRAF